jgi:hypothetical protein
VAEGIVQSPVEFVVEVDDGADPGLEDEPPEDDPSDDPSDDPLDVPLDIPLDEPLLDTGFPSPEPSLPELEVAPDPAPLFAGRRSFFAQPEPLKWTAGAANALRTGPLPQSGQLVGGSSCRPWITSNRRPQAAQR